MALQLYGFRDKTQLLELMLRAHSIQEAQIIFKAYIAALNTHPISDIELVKQIRWGGLASSGFFPDGIINGGGKDLSDIPISGDLALELFGSPNNGRAFTSGALGNSPSSELTISAWIKFGSYASGWIINQGSTPDIAYDLLVSSNELQLSLSANGTTDVTGISSDMNLIDGEGIWVRATWEGLPAGSVVFYKSSDPLDTHISDVEWTAINQASIAITNIHDSSSTISVGENRSGLFSPDGFIGRVILTPTLEPDDAATLDMYPNRDTDAGVTQWESGGPQKEIWNVDGTAVIGVVT